MGTTLNRDGGPQSPVGHIDRGDLSMLTLLDLSAAFNKPPDPTPPTEDFIRFQRCRPYVDQFIPRQPHSVRPLSWIQVDSTTGAMWSPTRVGPRAVTLSFIYSGSSTVGGEIGANDPINSDLTALI